MTIAADSIGSDGYNRSIRLDKKVFRLDDMIIGFTSSFRMGQILRYGLKPPFFRGKMDAMEYMVSHFIPAVRDALKSGGFLKTENGEERIGCFMVGYEGRLFTIEGDLQVGENSLGFDAIGCGQDFALGSIFSALDLHFPGSVSHKDAKPETVEAATAKIVARCAMRAASTFSAHVGGPIHMETLNTALDTGEATK
ncbi:hypothetical protein [Kozakia baliensis]|uniref:hypothetical protein n=1 Tax=Kozakia baliensis TaxID=153496 RepID=UPI001C99CED7|nr:hypothetical protein [Kozakia baliensis]